MLIFSCNKFFPLHLFFFYNRFSWLDGINEM